MALELEYLDGRRWKLLAPYRWRDVVVPAGFITDFASTPRVIWAYLPPTGSYGPAAVIHDYLYVANQMTRAQADALFRQAMADAGVPRARRWLIYLAVRVGGGATWRRYRQHPELAAERGIPA